MSKFLFFFSIISVLVLNPFIKNKKEKPSTTNVVLWQKQHKLDWNDFKGTPKVGSPYAAECNWEINYSYSYNPHKNSKLLFEVNCYFNASKSWVRSTEKSEGLLQHEQVHFDIAEICARRLRRELADAKFEKSNFKTEVNTIFEKVLFECDSIQEKYDSETNHGLVKSKQSQWVKVVNKDLKSLEGFENTKQAVEPVVSNDNLITKIFKKINIF